jgi:hypothetical protein
MYWQRWNAILAICASVPTAVRFRIRTQLGHGFDLRGITNVFVLFSRTAGAVQGHPTRPGLA